MLKVQELKSTPSLELFSELVELLQDSVNDGASLGWVRTPETREARNYWTGVLEAVGRSERRLFVATDDHVCAGAVQLLLPQRENGSHRGEVQKLMVHTQFRRRGIGEALLTTLENAAAAAGLTLLVLDVAKGAPAQALYEKMRWSRVGEIPDYCRSTAGRLEPTVVYYRALAAAAGEF